MNRRNMTTRRPGILTVLTILMAINAIIAGVHYALIYLDVIPIRGDVARVTEFALADTVVTIVPSLIAAYGLWQLRPWAWALTMMLSGGYLHGMVALLTEAAMASQFSAMSLVSVYFLLFSIVLLVCLWRQRRLFF